MFLKSGCVKYKKVGSYANALDPLGFGERERERERERCFERVIKNWKRNNILMKCNVKYIIWRKCFWKVVM